jgi:AcrR family transcriptional regulator
MLPPGRHGLSRSYVAANQRGRILDAVAATVCEKGYAATSVEDFITAARVSRRTFYDNFQNKEDAYLAAFDLISSELITRVSGIFDASPDFVTGTVNCLGEFLELAAAEPQYAVMCIVEVLAAGPAAIARRDAIMRALVDVLRAGARTLPHGDEPPPLVAETVIGGVYEVVYSRVLRGEVAGLPTLLPELAYSVLLPYTGREAAERSMEGLRARP